MARTFEPIATALAALGLLAALGCADQGLSTRRDKGQEIVLSAAKAPTGLEPGSETAPYPLGLPSALKGRATYTANCAGCHGTWITAQEAQEIAKQAALPPTHPDYGTKVKELKAENRWPALPAKVGPDFGARAWRFQRTPGQLYQLIAYGRTLKLAGDPSKGYVEHPGPSGKLGGRGIVGGRDEVGRPQGHQHAVLSGPGTQRVDG